MKRKRLIELIKQEESSTLEFKTTDVLEDSKEIAIQMVSFANLYGGRILFGVNNDGTFEGAKIDFDKENNRIANIAKNKCSPIINFECRYSKSKKGDVLIIEIFPRIDKPTALVKRKHHEIESRVFYIRTSDGTRLVSDEELKWMFERKTYNINDKFMICLLLGINNYADSKVNPELNVKTEIFGTGSNAQAYYQEIFSLLSCDDITNLLKDDGLNLTYFLFEMLPLLILKSLSRFYEKTWFLEIVSYEKSIRTIERSLSIDSLFVNSKNINFPKKINAYNNIKFRIEDYLKRNDFTLAFPADTKINLNYEWDDLYEKYKISIIISKSDSFEFNIILYLRNYKFIKETTYRNEIFPMNKFLTNIECHFYGDLIFPFKENENLQLFFEYGKTLLRLIKYDWDIDRSKDLKNLPALINIESRINVIEGTLDRFFDLLERQLDLSNKQLDDIKKLSSSY